MHRSAEESSLLRSTSSGGDETIAAISTPAGEGAIALVRVSGAKAIAVADKIFRGKELPSRFASHVQHLGEIVTESGGLIDEAMMSIHQELTANGELVGTEGLTGPEAAKIVTHDGKGAPVVTDGPFAESKEFLAGYWLVDVESEDRAIEIAAKTSAAPGPGGRPMGKEIEVRPVMHR